MQYDKWSFPIGKMFGIPIRLHTFFLVLLGCQTLGALTYGKWHCLYWFILLGPILLFTVLFHELGHCLAARSVSAPLHPFASLLRGG